MKFSSALQCLTSILLFKGSSGACTNLVLNGDFEAGLNNWQATSLPVTVTGTDGETITSAQCFIAINDGTPYLLNDDDDDDDDTSVPPIDGLQDVVFYQTFPGICLLKQTIALPPQITTATLKWKDRFVNYADEFVDPNQEARVRVCLDDGNGLQEIWSTNPGDSLEQLEPNDRSFDISALVQGKSSIDLAIEEQVELAPFTWFLDNIVLEVCTCEQGYTGGVCGDPHFETWSGLWYDFHGICDLVLLESKDLGNAVGLDIHVRTKPRYEYSYIESAAIKLGEDVLEVGSFGEYWFNGVEGAEMPAKMAGKYEVTYEQVNKKRHHFDISIGPNGEAIKIVAFKDIVNVRIENATSANFGSSVGMMGAFETGSLLARDGATILEDHNLFGQEWEVLPSDPKLFQSPLNSNQHVLDACVAPVSNEGRRLGEGTISEEAATMACADYEGDKMDQCVFDVIAMNDLEVAEIHGAF